ncbi:hypothetical protein E2C01_050940 [Portunus trituberculatus]|uniref:Uncharacterized protein n=1 Tax=Portunus trituberculatus TaxID=210409 RepID=A0A5B7GDF6_PORTR|nr:hypothetical protein [Portunus trituberculatus]
MSTVAMAELRTQMSLCTRLPSCAPPTNTYSKFSLAQLVVLRGGSKSLDKRTIDTIRILFSSYPQTPAINKCKLTADVTIMDSGEVSLALGPIWHVWWNKPGKPALRLEGTIAKLQPSSAVPAEVIAPLPEHMEDNIEQEDQQGEDATYSLTLLCPQPSQKMLASISGGVDIDPPGSTQASPSLVR